MECGGLTWDAERQTCSRHQSAKYQAIWQPLAYQDCSANAQHSGTSDVFSSGTGKGPGKSPLLTLRPVLDLHPSGAEEEIKARRAMGSRMRQ